jgi:hypothetical protein
MKRIIIITLALLTLLVITKDYSSRMKAINKYQCAVYGYYEDCKTPLLPSERLK